MTWARSWTISCYRRQLKISSRFQVVRENPPPTQENIALVQHFVTCFSNQKAFDLAAMVVPELRRSQSYNTDVATVTNLVLRATQIFRPIHSAVDRANHAERLALRQRMRALVECMAYEQRPAAQANPEQCAEAEAFGEKAADIIGKEHCPRLASVLTSVSSPRSCYPSAVKTMAGNPESSVDVHSLQY